MVNFYKDQIISFCVVCSKYQIKGDGEVYTRACDKHADQEIERLSKLVNK